MINEVLILEGQFSKSIGFDSSNLYVSSLQFGSIEALRNKCLNGGKRSSQKIALNKIQKLTYNEENDAMSIHFLKDSGKSKSFYLEGFDLNLRVHFFEALAEASSLRSTGLEKKKIRDYSKFYLTIGGIILFTSVAAWAGSWPRTGRRTQLIKLMQDIGPFGVMMIGTVLILIVLYKMYKHSKLPENQHVYKRQ